MRKLIPLITIICTVAMGARLTQNVTLNCFNAGELSPLMNSRVELDQYRKGAKTLQNMLVRTQGPITRRPGTKYISAVKDATDVTRLIPFEDSNAYIVELGDYYARFYTDGAVVADPNGADQYEVDTPWDANDINDVQYAQNATTMWLVHEDYEPYKLYRGVTEMNDANWVCEAVDANTGPFSAENTIKSWTLTPDGTTGDVNIVSSDNLFDDDHVGALFQISHLLEGSGVTKQFKDTTVDSEGDANSTTIEVKKWQYYDVFTSGTWHATFYIQRSYDEGTTWETVYTVTYKFNGNIQYSDQETEADALYRMHVEDFESTYVGGESTECWANFNTRTMIYNGVVEITTVTNATTVVAEVQRELASATATWRWAEGAWSDYRGWPRTVEIHEQRVIFAGSKSYPQTLWASIIADEDDDYDIFTANTESDYKGNLGGPDDVAWTYTLPGLNPIQWIKTGEFLFVGTTTGVGKLGQPGKPITPNFPPIYRVQNYNGCAFIKPAEASEALLYVERGKQKVRELNYTFTTEKYIAPDMTILAEHITGGGIEEIAFMNRPDPILWCVREDGVLLSFTYERRNDVVAWGEHTTGASGEFESVACIPGATTEDELWTLVARTVNSSSVRYVEQFQPFYWDKVSSPYDQNDCYFVDSGTGAWNTLTHLEGETVYGYADGRPIGSYTVSSGAISPTGTYTNKLAGLAFTSVYETMPLVLRGNDGPIMAEYTDIMDMRVKFYRSLGCHIGKDSSYLTDFEFSDDDFATTLDVVTDFKIAPYVWGNDRAPTIYFSETDPIPLSIEALHAKVNVTYDQ